ncbi:MAG: VWA domain-containing protein [Planctomycetes bacterium]|nr:VWA domain-containing protein [Planctomycetota bacterium]NOG55676.1 VWA domain-containing protein [Planctomycetota bacterium]
MRMTILSVSRQCSRFAVGVAAAVALVCGSVAGTPVARAGGLLIADGGFGGRLEIREHIVNVTIRDGIAITEVEQVFFNTERRVVEALYTFPVPKGASVSNFSMWINGKEMIGEVAERERARKIYESYKETRRDPGLLEQVDYKRFEMRVFPIAAESEQRVSITYYQELDVDNDWASYVYPLQTSTRSGIDETTTGRFAITCDIESTIPLTQVTSPTHADDFVFVDHAESYWQASLEVPAGDLSRDVVINYKAVRPRTGLDLLVSRESSGREDGYFCLTMTAGQELEPLDTGQDYVFVLDVSGSMRADSKLELTREQVASFVDVLGPKDRFDVLTFSAEVNRLFGQLTEAGSDAVRAQTHAFLDSQEARGGTSLKPAVELAYGYQDPERPLLVVILSDGMTEQKERSALVRAIQSHPDNSRVFCIGVGNDVNKPLLEQVAQRAGGLAAFVSFGDDFDRQARAFRRKLTRPVVSDIAVNVSGVDVYDLEPNGSLPPLYHGTPVRVYGRYQNPGVADVILSGRINDTPFEKTLKIEFPAQADATPEIERMWAWHRVDRLLKEADAQGAVRPQSVIDEVVRLGEGYSIASEYTSFIVLENDAEYRRWSLDRKNAVRIKRDRAARDQVQSRLAAMRDKAQRAMASNRAQGSDGAALDDSVTRYGTKQPVPVRQSTGPANSASAPSPGRSADVDWDSGGGAIDPVSAIAIIILALLAVWRVSEKRVLSTNSPRHGSGRVE